MHEWTEVESSIIITNSRRQNYLQSIEERIDWDIKRLQSIINQLDNKRVKSFFMRILRAVYNRAVEKDLTTNRNPSNTFIQVLIRP